MNAYGMFKRAIAVGVQVPGLPLTIPGSFTQYERLPGMSEWAPHEVITRMGKGMHRGEDLDALIEKEKEKGLGKSLAMGAAGGGLGGGLLGRLVSGEAATAPIKKLLREGTGTSLRGLRGLSRIPGAAKALALGGVGLGTLAGSIGWGMGSENRADTARAVAQGLRREQIMQMNANLQNRELRRQILNHNPMPSATAAQPLVAQVGKAI
jgi:hypothetical protein